MNMFEWKGHCQRCYKKTNSHTMSYFSTKLICLDCDTKERAHSKFKEAQVAEHNAILSGNLNFEGIGEPEDL